MVNLIVAVIILLIVGAAIIYIIRAKKSGVKCIGCPAGGNCSGHCSSEGCCGCHSDSSK